MVNEDIKKINDNRKQIRRNYFKDTNQEGLLVWLDKPAEKGEAMHMLEERTRDEIKNYYIKQIGQENLKNSPDYDVELIEVDVQGNINDINFHDGFSNVLIKDLAICFGTYFICGLLGLIMLSMGYAIIALILALIGWVFHLYYVGKTLIVIVKRKIRLINLPKYLTSLNSQLAK